MFIKFANKNININHIITIYKFNEGNKYCITTNNNQLIEKYDSKEERDKRFNNIIPKLKRNICL